MIEHEGHDEVMACVPALGQYALLVRTLVSVCGTLEGFAVDELEDLRLLANEVFHSLRSIGVGPIDLRLSPMVGELALSMSVDTQQGRTLDDADAELVETVAGVLRAESSFEQVDGRTTFRAVVRPGRR